MKDNLTMLIDPVYTARHIAACQSAYTLRRIGEHWLNGGDNRRIYFLTPTDNNPPFRIDMKFDDERVIRVPVQWRMDRFRELWFPTDDHRNAVKEYVGTHGDWDVLLTTRNLAYYWRRSSLIQAKFNKQILLYEPFPLLRFKKTFVMPEGSIAYEVGTMQTLSSYLAFDKIYVKAEFERKGILVEAKKFLSHAMYRKLDKNLSTASVSVTHGVPQKYPTTAKAKKFFIESDPFTIFYTQRVGMSQRRFDKVHKTLSVIHSKMKADGVNVRIKACTNSTGLAIPSKFKNDLKFMDLGKLERDAYWKELKAGHCFISFSIEEGLPGGLVEATQFGLIGVIERHRWSESMFGKDYPFMVKGVPESIAVLSWIYRNKVEAWTRWLKWYKSYFTINILDNADLAQLVTSHCDDHFSDVDRDLRMTSTLQDFVANVKKGKVKRIDLLNLKNIPGVRSPWDEREKSNVSAVYHRGLVWRWRLGYVMRKLYGWKLGDKPWILVK